MTRSLVLPFAILTSAAPVFAQAPAGPVGPARYAPAGAAEPARTAAAAQPGYPVRPISGPQTIAAPAAASPAPAIPAAPQPPEWVRQMSPEEQKWIDDVLLYWEARSDKVKTFECAFKRWDYDPIFGPKGDVPKTYAEGSIKYAQPDKGLLKVEKLWGYVPPAKPGDKTHVEQDASYGEHWVCDGKNIYSFEAQKKQLTITALPPEMRGRAIADGPLPFLFGAKAETIKARYWVRNLPPGTINLPENGKGKYCLEAVPKARQDAQNFSKVWIVLDEKDFLPEIITVFAPNYDPQRNPTRQTYAFSDRKATDQESLAKAIASGLDPLNLFHREFYEPKLPAGWKRVVLQEGGSASASAPPQQAAQPAAPQRAPLSVPR